MAKINITLDDELLQRIDKYADEIFMSRSGFISLCCANYLSANEGMIAIKNISLAMQKIADNGQVDDETLKTLEDFKRVVDLIYKVK